MKPSLLSKFQLEFEHQENVIDYKALLNRIKALKRKKVAHAADRT